MTTLRAEDAPSSSSGGIYDVFLSFRDEDIGKTFADHLCSALNHSGFHIFRKNDSVERGENMSCAVENAIKGSRTSIIIFSKGFASSTRCLEEVRMILQHKATSSDHIVLPVFYDVNPSDVRGQKRSFEEAFKNHEEELKEDRGKVEGWKAALREAADLAGMDLQNESNG